MSVTTGQPRPLLAAARAGTRHGGRVLHGLGGLLLAMLLLLPLAVAGLAWRLAEGPLDVTPVATRLLRGQPVTLERATLAWDGFDAPQAPLRLVLTGLSGAFGPVGQARLDRAEISLPVAPLLHGEVVPSAIVARGLHVTLRPDAAAGAGGSTDLADLLRRFPDHVRLTDAAIDAPPARLDDIAASFDRTPAGLAGQAHARIVAAEQEAALDLTARLAPTGTELTALLTPVSPARLAALLPPLALLDAPVGVRAQASLDPQFGLHHAAAQVAVGPGTIHAGTGSAPLLDAALDLAATPAGLDATVTLRTAARPDATPTRFDGTARIEPAASGYTVAGNLRVDAVTFADLPALWPEGTGGPGTRPWMTKNIPDGRLQDGHVSLALAVPAGFSDVALQRIDGAIDGHDLTVHWLRPVPPLEHAEGRLTITEPDVIDIAVTQARQSGGALQFHDGRVHLTGIAGHDQFAEITTGLAGPLADLLAVLKHPKVGLLAKRPVPLHDPAGTVAAQVRVAKLPLKDDVSIDALAIDTTARLDGVHLGGLAMGRDLDRGALDLAANNDGLTIGGTADLAGLPARLKVAMDFRDGPPAQVTQSVDVHTTLPASRLAGFGLDTGGRLGGAATLDAALRGRRDGRQDIALDADLAGLSIAEPSAGIAKAADQPGHASARIRLQGDHLVAVDSIAASAPGIDIRAAMQAQAVLHLERLRLGTGTDVAGDIRLPGAPGGLAIRLAGRSLDLSPLLGPAPPAGGDRAVKLPDDLALDLAFDRVLLGGGRRLTGVVASASLARGRLRQLDARATGPTAFTANVAAEPGGRRLTARATDLGALLATADLTGSIGGGQLDVAARWDDLMPDPALHGVVTLSAFRVRDAPLLARLLKAVSIYGLVDLLRGPGVGVTRLEAPFTWAGRVLTLQQARAFSLSLGVTAEGTIDLDHRTLALDGTVVPVYFFNSLLGRLPGVGRLFTAERGGGLFAAKVALRGPLDDPHIAVNPLSALTPGFLRGLFGDARP